MQKQEKGDFTREIAKTLEILKGANRIVIVTHQRPDGDALGSATALSHLLDTLKIDHDIFCVHEAPDHYTFLPNIQKLSADEKLITEGDHDVLVVLDSGDLAYAGIDKHLEKRYKTKHFIVNIDHHTTNTRYGDVNLVNPEASSTAEIIYHLFDHENHPITTDIATCILTGIITDTDGFSNLATTSTSLNVASTLIASGARVWDIQAYTQKNKSVNTLKLWGLALSRLHKHPSGVVTTILTQKDLAKCNADAEAAEGIANFLNSVEDAKAIMMIREDEEGKIKVSMRTTQPGVDVAKFAKYFGGGGHKKASGFSLPGTITQTDEGFHIL